MASTKTVHETFTEEEHAQLIAAKGDMTWHEFIMTLVKRGKQ
jgi:hypothetical protein